MAKYEDGSYGSAAGIALIAGGRGQGQYPGRQDPENHDGACRLCHGCRDCGHHQPGGW